MASFYYERVMLEWKKNWIVISDHTESEEFKRGHIEAAIVSRISEQAYKAKGKSKTTGAASTTSPYVAKGSTTRQSATDTW